MVVHLSSQKLTPDEVDVLSLGLGFCPDSNYNLFDTVKDINLFIHKLNLKALHHNFNQSTSGTSALMQLIESV